MRFLFTMSKDQKTPRTFVPARGFLTRKTDPARDGPSSTLAAARPGDNERNGFASDLSENNHAGVRLGRPPLAAQDRRSWNGGARRDRTDDLMLAKHALSQLSYGPRSPGPNQPSAPRRRQRRRADRRPAPRSAIARQNGGPGRT